MVARTAEYFLQGKCKWLNNHQPDKFSKWGVVLYPTEASLEVINKLKENRTGHKGIMNTLKKDDEGYYMTFAKKTEIKKKDGSIQRLTPPELFDGTQKLPDGSYPPLKNTTLVGNGSDVTIKIEVYHYKDFSGSGEGSAARWVSARIDNLIPYGGTNDLSPHSSTKDAVAGLGDQPEQLF